MDPFSITCTTCKSRLKVRSAAVIGQVVSCPKCGGMVLVKAPEEVSPEVANAATKPVEPNEKANPHNTKDFDDIESILAGKGVAAPAAARREARAAVATPPASASSGDLAATSAPALSAADSPSPEHPPQPISPPAARRYSLWLALSVLIGIGLATAVVIAGSLFRGSRGTPVASADVPTITPAKSDEPPPDLPPDNDRPDPRVKTPPTAEAPVPAPKTDAAPQTPSPASKGKAKDKAGDPLGIADPPNSTGKNNKPPELGEDPLGKFGHVLEGANDNPLPPAEAPPVPEMKVDDMPPDDAMPAAPRPAPRTVDVPQRLNDPLPGIDVPGVPLADFLADLSSLSTISITLDPEGLPLVGLSAATPVSLKAENTTIGEALDTALAPLRLERRVLEDQVVVGLSRKLSDRAFPVEDLTGRSEEHAQQLAEWATALVDPAVWKDGEEEGPSLTPGAEQFAVRASDRTYAGLLMLMEKLRVARGLAVRTKQPADIFRLEPRSAKVSAKLQTPISLNYSQPELVLVILRRLEKEGEIRILVDWQSLAAEGWNADGEGTLSVQDRPLGEALSELLRPMDLTWRVIDEQTVQVTTLSALHQTLELEVYPAGNLAADAGAGNALLARLRASLTPAANEESRGALFFDPVSGSILASLPQPQQQQVEKLLEEWGK